jgi:hypothetical protein
MRWYAQRVDAGADLIARGVSIRNVENRGLPASLMCGKYVKDLAVASLPYYNGAHASGVTLAASAGLDIQGLVIDNITSWAGSAFGLRAVLHCSNVTGGIAISRVSTLAGAPYRVNSYIDYPQEPPTATNIFFDETATSCTVTALPFPPGPAPPVPVPGWFPPPPAPYQPSATSEKKQRLDALWAVLGLLVVAVFAVVVVMMINGVLPCRRIFSPKAADPAAANTKMAPVFVNPAFQEPAVAPPVTTTPGLRPATGFQRPRVIAAEYVDSGSSDGEDIADMTTIRHTGKSSFA